MKTYTPTNAANLNQAILWQYEKAERLKALIQNQQTFFDDSTTAFWNDYRDNIFSVNPWAAVTVTNSLEPEFNLTYVFDSVLKKWVNGDYTIFKSIMWYMTGNGKTYTAPDNGLSIPPATFTRTLDYPLTITISGTGTLADGNLHFLGIFDGYPAYRNSTATVDMPGTWRLIAGPGAPTIPEIWHQTTSNDSAPPKTEWGVGENYGSPAPTLEYTLEASAKVEPAGSSPFCLSMWGIILGVLRPSYMVDSVPTSFSDAMYARLLWARMLNLRMNASMSDINLYMNILFSGKPVSVVDNFNMTISYYFGYTLTAEEEALIAIDGVLPRPAGVDAIIGDPPPESTVFGFSGQNLGQFDRSSFAPES